MNKKDLQEAIIPTKLFNQIPDLEFDESLNTEDLIYIESSAEVANNRFSKQPNDFSMFIENLNSENTNQYCQMLRDFYVSEDESFFRLPMINDNGELKLYNEEESRNLNAYFAPCMRLDIKKYFDLTGLSPKNFCTEKTINGQIVRTLPFGEFPQTKVDLETKKTLLAENYEVMPYVLNQDDGDSNTIKIYPYIKIGNQEYLVYFDIKRKHVADAIQTTITKDLFKVEPVEYIIKNWDRLPTEINPYGTGEDDFFDVSSEKLFSASQFQCEFSNYEENIVWKDFSLRFQINGVTKELFDQLEQPEQDEIVRRQNQTFIGATINKPLIIYKNRIYQENIIFEQVNLLPINRFEFGGWGHQNLLIRKGEKLNFQYVYINKNNNVEISKDLPQKGEYLETIVLDNVPYIFNDLAKTATLVADQLECRDYFDFKLPEPRSLKDFKFAQYTSGKLVLSKEKLQNADSKITLDKIQRAYELGINLQYDKIDLGYTPTQKNMDKVYELGFNYVYLPKGSSNLIATKKAPALDEIAQEINLDRYCEIKKSVKEIYGIQKVHVNRSTSSTYGEQFKKLYGKDFNYAYVVKKEDDVLKDYFLSKQELPNGDYETTIEFSDIENFEGNVDKLVYDKLVFKYFSQLKDKQELLIRLKVKYLYCNQDGVWTLDNNKPKSQEIQTTISPNSLMGFKDISMQLQDLAIEPLINRIELENLWSNSLLNSNIKDLNLKYVYLNSDGKWILSKKRPKQEEMQSTLVFNRLTDLKEFGILAKAGISEVLFDKIKILKPDSVKQNLSEEISSLLNINYSFLEPESETVCFSKTKPQAYIEETNNTLMRSNFPALSSFGEDKILINKIIIDNSLYVVNVNKLGMKYLYQNTDRKWVASKDKPLQDEYLQNVVLQGEITYPQSIKGLTPLMETIIFGNGASCNFEDDLLDQIGMKYIYVDVNTSKLAISKQQPQEFREMLRIDEYNNIKIDFGNFKGENLISEIICDLNRAKKAYITGLDFKYLYPARWGGAVYSNRKPELDNYSSSLRMGETLNLPLRDFSGEYLFESIYFDILKAPYNNDLDLDLAKLGFKYLSVIPKYDYLVCASKHKPQTYQSKLDLSGARADAFDIGKFSFSYSGEILIDTIICANDYHKSLTSQIAPIFNLNYLSYQPSYKNLVLSTTKPEEKDIDRTFVVSSNTIIEQLRFDGDVMIDNIEFQQNLIWSNNEISVGPTFQQLGIKYSYVKQDQKTMVVSRYKPRKKETSTVWYVSKSAMPDSAVLDLENNLEQIIFAEMDLGVLNAYKHFGFKYQFIDKDSKNISVSKNMPSRNSYITQYVYKERDTIVELGEGNLIEQIIIPPEITKVHINGKNSDYHYLYVDKKSKNLSISQNKPRKTAPVYEAKTAFPVINLDMESLLEAVAFDANIYLEDLNQFSKLGLDHLYVSKKTKKLIASKRAPKQKQILDEYILPDEINKLGVLPVCSELYFNKIVLHDHIVKCRPKMLKYLNFKNYYVDNAGKLVISNTVPEKSEYQILAKNVDITKVFPLESMSYYEYPEKWLEYCKNPKLWLEAIRIIQKTDINFSLPFLSQLDKREIFEEFLTNSKFKHFKQIAQQTKDKFNQVDDACDFYKLVTSLGCFSEKPLLDKKGNNLGDTVGRKACELVKQVFAYRPDINGGAFHPRFASLPIILNPNQDLLAFLAHQENKKLVNLDMLLNLEHGYVDVIPKTIANFARVQELYENGGIDEAGLPFSRNWQDSIKAMCSEIKYTNVTSQTAHIADVYAKYGISNNTFDFGVSLHEKAQRQNVPQHILSKPLKESELIEEAIKVAQNTSSMLGKDAQMLDDYLSRNFTYEMLAKDDPLNGIMGAAASCCGSITSFNYGKKIAISTVLAPNVQNLVVRDKNSEVIAKGSMYVNEELGYAVINDFEINQEYKKGEDRSLRASGGYYDDSYPETTKSRQEIFDAFKRGIYAFVKEYDKEHADKPLQKVAVGMGYNRLKKQCEEFEKIDPLCVPEEYGFNDAHCEQRLIYDREKQLLKQKDGGLSR